MDNPQLERQTSVLCWRELVHGPRHRKNRRISKLATFGIIATIFLTISGVLLSTDSSSTTKFSRRSGNPEIAGDLYGIGVRLGIYFQALGMVISADFTHTGGVKIACAASMVAELATWTNLAWERAMSPAEAYIVLLLTIVLALPGTTMAFRPDPEGGNFGSLALLVAVSWTIIVNLWFWISLYTKLPSYDTTNDVWILVKTHIQVDKAHIFGRILFILLIVVYIYVWYQMILRMIDDFRAKNGNATEEPSNEERDLFTWARVAVAFFLLIFVIPSMEKTIRYNHLTPTNAVKTPSQIIPLTIGLFIFMDGMIRLITD